MKQSTDVMRYISAPLLMTADEFKREVLNTYFIPAAKDCLYAVIDKTVVSGSGADRFAGVVSLHKADVQNASVEMGVTILPHFHGTGIATIATALLLCWLLAAPEQGGLGLRRIAWQTHVDNKASRKLAERLGFELEGIARWHHVVRGDGASVSALGLEQRNGRTELPGRHTAMYALCWDEWDEKKDTIIAAMKRRQASTTAQ